MIGVRKGSERFSRCSQRHGKDGWRRLEERKENRCYSGLSDTEEELITCYQSVGGGEVMKGGFSRN